jgi:hypothetical protein
VIKNLKYSSVYEETVRQVEEQAKLKAERYEEGELSEDSSDIKEASPTEDDRLVMSPGILFCGITFSTVLTHRRVQLN